MAINQFRTRTELQNPRSELIADNQTELKTVQNLHKSGADPENSERGGRDT